MRFIDTIVERLHSLLRWLALPVALVLFLQWPLREWLQAQSREANDLGQMLFALFVAASVTAATRAHAHLATDVLAKRHSATTRRGMASLGIAAALLPWALFIGWSAKSSIRLSVLGLERFPDSGNAGYFVVKSALALLVVLIVLQGLLDLGRWARTS